jgi:SAM-dependent methyltransferase
MNESDRSRSNSEQGRRGSNDALHAEFDTVAEWTADVALDLGRDYFLPAACRGSGSPSTLRWFIDRLAITRRDRMLDCGAGMGGPAAFAAYEVGVAPVLSDPEAGACRAARRLFGLPVVRAGSELPFASGSFDVIWSLGVLCTVADQARLLDELRRVLTPTGRLGLLVFVARTLPLSNQPSGNSFPTDERLRALLDGAGLSIKNSGAAADFAASPTRWQERADAVQSELERRHRGHRVWQTAAGQSELIGRLLSSGEVAGTMLFTRPG